MLSARGLRWQEGTRRSAPAGEKKSDDRASMLPSPPNWCACTDRSHVLSCCLSSASSTRSSSSNSSTACALSLTRLSSAFAWLGLAQSAQRSASAKYRDLTRRCCASTQMVACTVNWVCTPVPAGPRLSSSRTVSARRPRNSASHAPIHSTLKL